VSITKKNEISIAVTRKVRAQSGAGGYTETTAAIVGSPFAGRRIIRKIPQVVDGVPGLVTIDTEIFVFPTAAGIRYGDICTVAGKTYQVRGIRMYSRNKQAEVEMI
jgi:hypothetical protein